MLEWGYLHKDKVRGCQIQVSDKWNFPPLSDKWYVGQVICRSIETTWSCRTNETVFVGQLRCRTSVMSDNCAPPDVTYRNNLDPRDSSLLFLTSEQRYNKVLGAMLLPKERINNQKANVQILNYNRKCYKHQSFLKKHLLSRHSLKKNNCLIIFT